MLKGPQERGGLGSDDVGRGEEDGAVLTWEERAVPLKDIASISLSGGKIKAAVGGDVSGLLR